MLSDFWMIVSPQYPLSAELVEGDGGGATDGEGGGATDGEGGGAIAGGGAGAGPVGEGAGEGDGDGAGAGPVGAEEFPIQRQTFGSAPQP